jgi:homoserine O-acetyltransferase
MMDMFDLVNEYGSIEKAFANTTCRFLIVSISSDWLFNAEQQLQIVKSLIANRKPVSYFQIDSHFGHDAFLIEYEVLGTGISAFLDNQPPSPNMPTTVNLTDMEHIANMIDEKAHVLDVGSGSGELFCALKRRKNITGICLDLDFNKIVECMSKGLPALQLDANTGLEVIAPNAFDCILLNQTIQQLRSGLQTIKQILHIASKGVIGFTNFAFYAYRLSIFLRGQLPVSGDLPYEWYNTPNIHLVTVKDFRELCTRHNITIDNMEYISDDPISRMLLALGMDNLGCERSLVKISRGNE